MVVLLPQTLFSSSLHSEEKQKTTIMFREKLHFFFKFELTYLSTYQQHLFLATVLPTTHCKEKQTAIVLRSQLSSPSAFPDRRDDNFFGMLNTIMGFFYSLLMICIFSSRSFFLLTRSHKNLHLSPKAYKTFREIQPDILLPGGIKSLFV